MFINFWRKFLPTLLKSVGKISFYLVPTRLLGPARLLNSMIFSHLHDSSGPMLIRHLRVPTSLPANCVVMKNKGALLALQSSYQVLKGTKNSPTQNASIKILQLTSSGDEPNACTTQPMCMPLTDEYIKFRQRNCDKINQTCSQGYVDRYVFPAPFWVS